MPMETVEFVLRHYVQIFLHLLNREEMAGTVQMNPAVTIGRGIADFTERNHPVGPGVFREFRGSITGENCRRQHLADCRNGIDHPVMGG